MHTNGSARAAVKIGLANLVYNGSERPGSTVLERGRPDDQDCADLDRIGLAIWAASALPTDQNPIPSFEKPPSDRLLKVSRLIRCRKAGEAVGNDKAVNTER